MEIGSSQAWDYPVGYIPFQTLEVVGHPGATGRELGWAETGRANPDLNPNLNPNPNQNPNPNPNPSHSPNPNPT